MALKKTRLKKRRKKPIQLIYNAIHIAENDSDSLSMSILSINTHAHTHTHQMTYAEGKKAQNYENNFVKCVHKHLTEAVRKHCVHMPFSVNVNVRLWARPSEVGLLNVKNFLKPLFNDNNKQFFSQFFASDTHTIHIWFASVRKCEQ